MYLNVITVITTKILHHNTHLLHYWLSLINLVVNSVHIAVMTILMMTVKIQQYYKEFSSKRKTTNKWNHCKIRRISR